VLCSKINSFPTVQYFLIKCFIRTPFRPFVFSLYENTGGGGVGGGLDSVMFIGFSATGTKSIQNCQYGSTLFKFLFLNLYFVLLFHVVCFCVSYTRLPFGKRDMCVSVSAVHAFMQYTSAVRNIFFIRIIPLPFNFRFLNRQYCSRRIPAGRLFTMHWPFLY